MQPYFLCFSAVYSSLGSPSPGFPHLSWHILVVSSLFSLDVSHNTRPSACSLFDCLTVIHTFLSRTRHTFLHLLFVSAYSTYVHYCSCFAFYSSISGLFTLAVATSYACGPVHMIQFRFQRNWLTVVVVSTMVPSVFFHNKNLTTGINAYQLSLTFSASSQWLIHPCLHRTSKPTPFPSLSSPP